MSQVAPRVIIDIDDSSLGPVLAVLSKITDKEGLFSLRLCALCEGSFDPFPESAVSTIRT